MTPDEFKQSLVQSSPPLSLNSILSAMWWDGKNEWGRAHDIVQDDNNADAAWVHAYLHRKEGDNRNADYWYLKAGQRRPSYSLDQEWEQMVNHFLSYK